MVWSCLFLGKGTSIEAKINGKIPHCIMPQRLAKRILLDKSALRINTPIIPLHLATHGGRINTAQLLSFAAR